jgi:acetylornithine deacetylase/succinyl-diaminopimelate desuccinylase-like protein
VSDWFDELAEFLRIPSISADPERAEDVWAAGQWVCDFIRGAGGHAELIDWEGQPLAIGEIRASADADRAPTLLCYGHFDVQPPDPLELWESEPFEPEIRGDHLYARGVADDKGQLYLLLHAARELASAGRLPINVRFACDGEEETGGQSIIDYLATDTRGADAAVIFDSEMVARGVPAFNIATRGMAYFHLELRSGRRDLHSGIFGGAALNAIHALMACLSAVVPRDGRLPEPLRAGIAPPSAEELQSWQRLPAGTDQLVEQGARPADPEAAQEFYLRTFAEPSLEINGIEGGSPRLQKTVLPVHAVANVSIRLAPGQDVEVIARAFEELVTAATPEGAQLDVQLLSFAPPGLIAPDAPAVRLAQDAFERVIGARPLLIRSGGSLPIVPALSSRGIPTIVSGFSLPDANIHSPNERLLVDHVPLGIATARALIEEFAKLNGG